MKIADIDLYALKGDSLLHKTAVEIKLLWVVGLIFLVVVEHNYKILLPVYLLMLFYVIFSKLPAKIILVLSYYPVIFALLFLLSASNWSSSLFLLVFLKVVVASTAVILLFITTSYKTLFTRLNKFLPGFIATALFLTYRAIFILWAILGDIKEAIYLRGGLSAKNIRRSLQVIGDSVGLLVIRSIETSENMYEGMWLRGHSNSIRFLEEKKWTK
jgi:energy-coupling factor transporter transmembrane protein EcfT